MADHELKEFERELEAIPPRPSSPELKARIGAALTAGMPEAVRACGRRSRPSRWRVLLSCGLAAAAAAVFFILRDGPSGVIRPVSRLGEAGAVGVNASMQDGSAAPPGGTDVFRPMWAVTTLLAEADEGVQVIAGKGPVRRMRYHLLDRFGWRDRSADYSFESYRPREEVVYLPLEVQ